ncbi:MAG: hypothetical protein K0R65_7 [Crocinitomicaceae bacterium]|jgi:tyrocidine synthetase-3|nr:hypothetical protein [Crocinitomicaceae bacterium]
MDIAIIGVAGRFPDAKNVEELLANLRRGKDSARHLSMERMKATNLPSKLKYKVFSSLEGIDRFDYKYFEMSFAEAIHMDPHQRLLLEVVQEMFDSSAYDPEIFYGSNTGIFCGDVNLKYYELATVFDPTLLTGNINAVAAGRVARYYNLRGPMMMIDTNCSSTLVALDLACKEIRLGEVEQAIVCGARLVLKPDVEEGDDNLGIMVSDGKTKSFSEDAEGTGAGEAVAAILIKPLDKALQDEDIIYGVIKGTAVNQEAALSGSLTAPSSKAQAEVIQKAWKSSGVDPLSIRYIEPHGSGTKLGDPIEIQGIDLAYSGLGAEKNTIGVSALKSNIGHTDTVAGLSGLIKVVLSLREKEFFPSVHFNKPNQLIDFEQSHTRIVTKNEKWTSHPDFPRRAGLSSFGLSGTNAHIILEEAPEISVKTKKEGKYLIPVSGRSNEALQYNINALQEYLQDFPEVELADLAYTLGVGRKHYTQRVIFEAESAIELLGLLHEWNAENHKSHPEAKPFFIFSENAGEIDLNAWTQFEEFNTHYNECLSAGENPAIRNFAFQYAAYKQLEAWNMASKTVLGAGLGKNVIDVVTGAKTLEEGLSACATHNNSEIPNLKERVTALIEKQAANGPVAFILLGTESGLFNEIQAQQTTDVYAIDGTDLVRLVNDLYLCGVTVNWKAFYRNSGGQRIVLPAYRFDRVRCWLREPFSDAEEEWEYNKYHHPELAGIPESFQATVSVKTYDFDDSWTPTEQKIAQFWLEVLRLDKVELDDDFFKLGGHSLIATQLIARIEQEYGFRLLFKNITVFSSIRKLAEAVDERINSGEKTELLRIGKTVPQDSYPLSHAQKRLYIMQQFEGGGTSYNLPGAVLLKGKIDSDRFEQAINELIKRHESLRTSFIEIEGEPRQQVLENLDFKLSQAKANKEELTAVIAEFIQPFDLTQAPLFRAKLVELENGENAFLFDVHHIISDGISQELLVRDFVNLYLGENLPELPIQYKDFAVWQADQFASGAFLAQENYWKDRFRDELPVLELPYDFTRPKVQSFKGANTARLLNKEKADKIQALAQEKSATLYMALLAIYNVLLSKLSGNEDVIVGSPIAGRPDTDTEQVLGMFVNTLVMRNFPQADLSFSDFLGTVVQNANEAYENADYPFEKLLDELNIERDLGRNPLFDTMFSFQRFYNSDQGAANADFTVEALAFSGSTSKFDLTLEVFEKEEGLSLNLEYCTDLFTEATANKLLERFELVLDQILTNPELQLKDLEILQPQEWEEVIVQRNKTEEVYKIEQSFTASFLENVRKNPDALAVKYEDQTLTYAQLNEAANSVANYLLGQGFSRGTVVALEADPSLEMVIGFLGIVKSGAAFLPIDPAYPDDRVRYMLEKSGAKLMLTTKIANLRLEDLAFSVQSVPKNTEEPAVSSELSDTAYIVFTSGSTGKPKGVEVGYEALLNCLNWHITENNITSADCLSKYAGFAFDASMLEIYTPFLCGASLHIIPAEIRKNVDEVRSFMKKSEIAIAFLPTQMAEFFMEEDCESLRVLFVGGDKLKRYKANSFEVKNYYGPSENTVVSTVYRIQAQSENIPIGKALPNTQAYVLDKNDKPVPDGVVGELFVSGLNLAKGYINDRETTAERFLEHPFRKDERIYRTGDLAKWNTQGELEFMGRVDFQVKIRGYRIELGEIEHAILDLAGVKTTFVTDFNQADGNKALVAYILAEKPIPQEEVQKQLSATLPDYMLPAQLVFVDEIPLTANGKVDKKALPKPEGNIQDIYKAPASEAEQKVARLWKQVLGLEKCSVDSNFFRSGGHSLNATMLISLIRKEFDITIGLKDFFMAPTIEHLAKLLESSGQKNSVQLKSIEKADKYPVSSAQQRLYILQQLAPQTIAYNLPVFVKIKGDFDPQRFELALNEVIARHESLRTSFTEIDNQIYQIVDDNLAISLENLGNDPDSFCRPFDLNKTQLLRAGWKPLSEKEFLLAFDMHHIISDGVSMNNLLTEIAACYDGQTLEPLRVQYRDYAAWQHEFFQTNEFLAQRDFWLNSLRGAEGLNLPTDFPRPSEMKFEGNRVHYQLSEEYSAALEKLAQKLGATDFMVLLSLFNVLLHKVTGQENIILGTPSAGRKDAELQPLIGMFVNTLVLQNKVKPNATFSEVLEELKTTTLHALEYQDYQFDQLVEDLGVKRDTSRNPLFDVMFQFENMGGGDIANTRIGAWEIEAQDQDYGVSKFDLTFEVKKPGDCFLVAIEYAVHLFRKETVDRFFAMFTEIVKNVVNSPEIAIAKINFTPEQDRKLILSEFNDTKHAFASDICLHSLLEQQAALTPNKTALIFQDERLSYFELNTRANQLAHTLIASGIERGDIVALKVNRSFEMVIALLAIQKSGAAYLPIDPEIPSDRLTYLLKDSRSKVFLCDQEIDVNVPLLNVTNASSYAEKTHNPNVTISPDDLAYVIYTSGSTGEPKGVMLEHRGVVNRIEWMKTFYGFTPEDKVLQKTTYTFDVSVWEFFMTLCYGAELVLCEKEVISDVSLLIDTIEKYQISVLHFVPSMFKLFLHGIDETNKNRLASIKQIFTSGEALSVEYVHQHHRYLKAELHNLYGPTEASVDVSYFETSAADKMVPIGKPVWNTQLYVLNAASQLCPVGVAGELYIGGVQVARGYLNKAELTNERFVSNPFGEGRLYKTGDLVRWLPDGNIEFLGRIDFQVKIRGFRIELGDIESQLLKIDGLAEVAVIDKTDSNGDKFLCAYIVSHEELQIGEIKKALAQNLPDYMIPAYYVRLDQMPLNNSGKLDRKALPEVDQQSVERATYEAPQTETEIRLAELWSELLAIPEIGINDNFFAIGGQSLKATLLLAKMKRAFGVSFPLMDLFRHATIKEQARLLENATAEADHQITQAAVQAHYPLSPAQLRMFVLNKINPDTTEYNISQAFEIHGEVNLDKLKQVFQKLVERHEILRTHFTLVDNVPAQIIHEKAEIDLKVYTHVPVSEVTESFIRPFDLSQPCLMRVACIANENAPLVVLLDFHHIVMDGVSIQLLTQQFTKLYREENLALPDLQYKDFVLWQADSIRQGAHEKEKEFWLRKFDGELPVMNFPLDFPRPAMQTFDGNHLSLFLDQDLKKRIDSLCQTSNATNYMLLLGAYFILLGKYTSQEDLIVGTPVSGRTNPDVENMIGMFVNTLAIRSQLKPEETFLDFLEDFRDHMIACFSNQQYAFEELVNELKIERAASRNPLFDTLFSYIDKSAMADMIGESGLDIRPVELDNPVAQFDFQLDIQDFGQHIQCVLTYNTGLFREESMQRFLDHYSYILNQLLENPQARISDLSILLPEEKNQILSEFNATEHAFASDVCLHTLFENQAVLTPTKTALIFKNKGLTYGELNSAANRLARTLIASGIERGDIVALKVNRSFEMVIALLAIQKAGGAYLPIDPEIPAERLTYLLQDSRSKVFICDQDVEIGVPLINLKKASSYSELTQNPNVAVSPDDLAYVIYTSGSTGEPKGVMLEHRGVVNRIEWMKSFYGFTSEDKVLQKTTYTFDVSVWEFFMTLCYGAELVLCEKEVISDVSLLIETIEKHQISVLHFVPSMFKMFLHGIDENNKNRLASIKQIFTSGEALSAEYVHQHHHYLKAELHNLYGPTEASVDVSYFETSAADKIVPIGKPVWNTQLYVLNAASQLCPVGVAGELYIGGVQVARGYLNKEELTNERFVVNPFGEGRLYKTGDLVRWLPDGNIEFLGRIDFQVKIRGFRIELGDIESQLLKIEGLAEVAVIDKTDANGEKFLCAYIVSQEELQIGEIKKALAQNLPDYMIPAYYVSLDQMPLNNSGKLDRKALPEVNEESVERAEFVELQSKNELILGELWKQVLGIERVGAGDHFFNLGGDSIKAIQLSSLLARQQLKMPLNLLFQYPVLADLAQEIQVQELNISQEKASGYLPLTPVQLRFFEQNFAEPQHYNQSVIIEIKDWNKERFEQALQAILDKHDTLRIQFEVQNGEIRQKYAETELSEILNLPDENQLMQREEIAQQVDFQQAQFALLDAPLFQVNVYPAEDGTFVVAFIAHHLVIDAVSWRIILQDFQVAYGEQADIGPKTHTYKDWAETLQKYAETAESKQKLSYWKAEDQRAKDFNWPLKNTEEQIHKVSLNLSQAETTEIASWINNNASGNWESVLLTAFVHGFNKANKPNIAIAMESHGRVELNDDLLLTETVGWFTAIYPLAFERLPDDLSACLTSVDTKLKAIPDRGIDYGIQRYLGKENLSAQPQMIFNFLGEVNASNGAETSQQSWQFSSIVSGNTVSPRNHKESLLTINALLLDGQLNCSVEFSNKLLDPNEWEVIAEAAQRFLNAVPTLKMESGNNSEEQERARALRQVLDNYVFPMKQNSASKKLFFFPPAIGFSMVYQELANEITGYDVYGVNFIDSEDPIDIYVRKLIEINGQEDFYFAGYSGGANLAYRVALRLQEMGCRVPALIMLDGMREIEGAGFAETELIERVETYVSEKEGHASHAILKTEAERHVVKALVGKYQVFLSSEKEEEPLMTDLYQINSEQQWEEGQRRKEAWKDIIVGTVNEIQGVGEHGSMLNEPHFEQNKNAFLAVLEQIDQSTGV